MGRPQAISDNEIRQACDSLLGANRPVTVRGVHAITGGDLKRIGRIVDDYKTQHGLDSLSSTSPRQSVGPQGQDVSDAVKAPFMAAIKSMWQIAEQEAGKKHEADRIKFEEDTQQARDDRDYALNLNDQLARRIETLEDELNNEKAERLKDQERHAKDLKQAQDDFATQLKGLHDQIIDLGKQVQQAVEARSKAEGERDESLTKLKQATDKISELSKEVGDLTIGQAQAEGAKTVLESQIHAHKADFERLEREFKSVREVMDRLLTQGMQPEGQPPAKAAKAKSAQ